MNEQALQDAFALFQKNGYKKSIEDFKVLLNTNPKALEDSYSLFKSNGYKKDINQFKVLVGVTPTEKKNSNSNSTSKVKTSESRVPQVNGKPISGGEKPKKTTESASLSGTIWNKQPETLFTTVEKAFQEDSKNKAATPKVEKSKELISTNKDMANKAYDYALSKVDKNLSEERYNDEVDNNQFFDQILSGVKNEYNKYIGTPLSVINSKLGGNKNFNIGQYKPLEKEKEIAKKELDKEFKGSSYNPSLIEERAKEIFIKNDKVDQMGAAIDEYLPEGYDREGVWKELKLEELKSNDYLRQKVIIADSYNKKIEDFNKFSKEIKKEVDSKIEISEDKIAKFDKLKNEAEGAIDGLNMMAKNFNQYIDKAESDQQKLELFKYNYNDNEKSLKLIYGSSLNILGGSLKLLSKTIDYGSEITGQDKTAFGLTTKMTTSLSDSIANEMLSDAEEATSPFFRYKASKINSFSDLGSLAIQLSSEQLPILGAIYLGGNLGVAGVSMSSGGQKIKELEDINNSSFIKKYSEGQMLAAGWLYAGAEFIPEKLGTARILKDLEKTVSVASSASRKLFKDSFYKETLKGASRLAYSTTLEGGTELITSDAQITIDEELLNIVKTDFEKKEMRTESFLSGGLMGGSMSIVGGGLAFAVAQSKLYSDKQDIRRVQSIMSIMSSLQEEIDSNELLTEEEITSLYKEMNKLSNESFKIVSDNAAKGNNLTIQQKNELLDITLTQNNLREDHKELDKSNYSEGIKKQKSSELKNEFDKLEEKRNAILKGIKPSREIKAASKIKELEDELKTIKDDNNPRIAEIDAEITALEQEGIYYYNTDPNRGQVEPKPESVPEGYASVKEVENSAELDALNKQNEVSALRSEEQQELIEAIPNAENYLTNGKVDRSKLTNPEDIAKFKEIYDKYDKLISPLLDNTKTQEEVVQDKTEPITKAVIQEELDDEFIEIPEDEILALKQEVSESKIEGTLSENIGQKGYLGSKEGMIKIDDTNQNTIVFETNNEIIDLGRVDEDSSKSIASFGISKFPQEGVRTEAKQGKSIPVVKVDGKEVTGKTEKELKVEEKKRKSEERRKRREEFQAKTLEQLKEEERKSEKLLAKIEKEILDELIKKSKSKDLVKVGERVFQVTKKADGAFAVSQVNPEGKLVGIRDEATRNKAIGVFKSKKTKADKKDLQEAQDLLDGFKKDERDRIERLLDAGINALGSNGRAFDATIGVPVYIAKKALQAIKISYKAGKSLAEAIADGYEFIKKSGYSSVSELDFKEYVLNQLTGKKQGKDAIQKQSTGEIPVQPEATISEEVEQGESEAKPEESTEQSKKKVNPVKEVKDQLQELFSTAKEALKITKDRFKEIDKLKKDLNQFVKANLVGLDAFDIMKSASQKITSLIQNTNDANFEGQAEKINEVIDDLYLRRELKDEAVLDKKIKDASKDTFYKDKSSGKVTKTKVTDEFKKKIEDAKNKFSKIKNPSIAEKTAFYLEVNDLLKKGIKARKAINESRDSKSKDNANKLAIIALEKNNSLEPKRTVSLSDGMIDKIFNKFSGGVVFNGNIYLNTKSGKSKFNSDVKGMKSITFNPISTANTASSADASRSSIGVKLKDAKRRYATATFSANKFFEPLFSVKGAKEFLDKKWINRLKVYSERLGRKVSDFRDIRDDFFKDIIGSKNFINSNRILKSNTYDLIKAARATYKGTRDFNDPLWSFVGTNRVNLSIDVNGDKVEGSYNDVVSILDVMIKKDPSIQAFKDSFIKKYIPFEKMTNGGVAALFNMIRQPDGFNKFLNSYTIEDAKAVVEYVNKNPKIREVADKSTKLFESVRDYVNPTLDRLGYDTLGEVNYISKEDALSIKDTKDIRDFYDMLETIYPNDLPDKIPYYPLSAESLSGTNDGNSLEFFEDADNPNADYSLLFPSLFTRTAGGNLNINDLSISSSFDKVSKEAITLVEGSEIVSDVRNLYANEGNNVAMISAFGRDWNDKFKNKVLNIVRDDAYEGITKSDGKKGSALKFWVASRSSLRAAQLSVNAFSSISQLVGIPISYVKDGNLKYLKDTIKNLSNKKTRGKEFSELKEAYNTIISSKNYIERTNKRRDNAEVAAINSQNDNLGYKAAGAAISDLLIFTTLADVMSVIALTPIYKGKYKDSSQNTEAENVDEFFAEEVNKTLQSNAPFYTGTIFYQKWALALGLGGYLQSPRQIMEIISNDINSILRKEGNYTEKIARVTALASFGLILPVIIKEALRGDDEDEDKGEESISDRKTSVLQWANKISDSILDSMGYGGTLVSAVKNASLIKYSPDVMEMDVNPSDIKAQDIAMQVAKASSPNFSITLRGIDDMIDRKEIYSTLDQFLFGIETGLGFPGAKIKKQIDYTTAAGSEYYDYKDYWDLVSGKISQTEFKENEKNIEKYRNTLDKLIYPKKDRKNMLNTSFLNNAQINELSKMSFEQKEEYIEDIRMNLIRASIISQLESTKKIGGMSVNKNYYKVRESVFKSELSNDILELLKGKIFDKDNLTESKDLTGKLNKFAEEEGISSTSKLRILEESISKAEKQIINEDLTTIFSKKIKESKKGKDRARVIRDNIGILTEGDNIKYIDLMGEDFDNETIDEYLEILKKEQE